MPFLEGDAGGGSNNHALLTNLSWTVSGHLGAPGSLASFNGAGAASLLSGIQPGDLAYFDGTIWTRLPPGTPGTFLQQGVSVPTWTSIPPSVVGPAAATPDAIARFDGPSGQILDNSLVTIDDFGVLKAPEIQTGDLVLHAPERQAHWRIREHEEHIEIINENTGKRYRLALIPEKGEP